MSYKIFQLTDFDFTKLEVVKETVMWLDEQDHSRWVLKTLRKSAVFGGQEFYLKIWNPTYIRRDNILAGIDVGFYDEQITPALIGLIFHNGVCRGYAANKCTRYWMRQLDDRFYNLIQEKSAKTGYFSYQFSPYHVMRYKSHLNLIDLEGIYPIGELHKLPKYHSRFDDIKYEKYISGLYNERHTDGIEQPQIHTARNEPVGRAKHFLERSVQFLWKQSIAFFKEPMEKKPNHVYLIQK